MFTNLVVGLASGGTIAIGAVGIFEKSVSAVECADVHRVLWPVSAAATAVFPIEAWLNADHSLPMPAPSKEVTESRFTPSSLFLISITFTRASTFPRTSGSCGIEQSR